MKRDNFLKNLFLGVISNLLFLAVRFSFISSKKYYYKREVFDHVVMEGKPVIFMCWHGRLYVVPNMKYQAKSLECDCIVSNNNDGEIAARILKKCGFGTIRGSSNKTKKEGVIKTKYKGGTNVIRQTVKSIRSGKSIGLTPDGPRGPSQKFNSNLLNIAAMTGAKIIPMTLSSKRCLRFNSWDKFMFPLPFSKIYIKFGDPTEVKRNATEDELKNLANKIEKNLNEITEDVDNIAGVI